MEWELTKENCVPVRQGRSKAALQELADPAAEALEAKRRELWAEVAEYQGDDPLEAWQKYIKWMHEYGVGGGKADLLKVLEACTKDLQKYPRYTNDIRFLRIWIQYADCLPDPGDVFLFLKEKGIGRSFALYYEAYATYFELRGNFPNADAVYMDGLQRGAKPLERLKQKHHAFQQRMAHRMQRKIEEDQAMGPPAPEPVRSSLAAIGHRPGGRSRPQQQQPPSLFGAEGPQHNPLLFGSRTGQHASQDQRRPVVSVLADDENGFPGLPGYSSMPQVNNLRELKPYGVVRKENMDRPTAWNQATLPSGGRAAAGGGSGLDIFTDEEFKDGDDDQPGARPGAAFPSGVPAGPGASAGHPVLLSSAVPGPGGGMDSLMSSLALPPALLRGAGAQPFAVQSLMGSVPAVPKPQDSMAAGRDGKLQPPSTSGGPTVSREPPSAGVLPSGQRIEPGLQSAAAASQSQVGLEAAGRPPTAAVAPDEDCGMAGTGDCEEEFSYEELRAVAWFRRNPLPPQAASNVRDSLGASSSIATSSLSGSAAAQGPGTSAQAAMPAADCENPPKPLNCGTGPRAFGRDLSGASQPSLADGENCAPMAPRRAPFGQVPLSASAEQPLAAAVASENAGSRVSLVSHGATDSVVPAKRRVLGDAAPGARPTVAPLHEPLPTASSAAPQHPAPSAPAAVAGPSEHFRPSRHDDLQPTVTISTRNAYDLMNSLFSDDLPHQQRRGQPERPGPLQPRAPEPCPALPEPRVPLASRAAPEPVLAQPQRPAAAPVAASAAAAAAGASEPTVTLHTRLAFDALNDMFSDTLPHEEARKLARRAGVEGSTTTAIKPITTSDVCRLANASRTMALQQASGATGRLPFCSGGPGGGFAGASSNPAMAPAAPPSLAMHEDTFFLGSAAPAIASGRGPLGATAAAMGPSHGPLQQSASASGLYEDTDFVPRVPSRGTQGPAGASGRGAPLGVPAAVGQPQGSSASGIYEDTDFIPRGPPRGTQGPAVASGRGARVSMPPAVGQPQGPSASGIYEDTDFIPRGPSRAGYGHGGSSSSQPGEFGVASGRGSAGSSQAHLQQAQNVSGMYEDTDFIPRGPSRGGQGLGGSSQPMPTGLPGGALILEDTEFITRPQAPSLAMAALASNGLGRDYRAHGENAGFAAPPVPVAASHGRAQQSALPMSEYPGRSGGFGTRRDSLFANGSGANGLTARPGVPEAPLQQRGISGGSLQVFEDMD